MGFVWFHEQESKRKFSRLLEYVTCLVHLAVFGILGVTQKILHFQVISSDIF